MINQFLQGLSYCDDTSFVVNTMLIASVVALIVVVTLVLMEVHK